jgi:hypothetical protein
MLAKDEEVSGKMCGVKSLSHNYFKILYLIRQKSMHNRAANDIFWDMIGKFYLTLRKALVLVWDL